MSLATYSGLYTSFTRWVRGRTDLETYFPDLLALAEQRVFYGMTGDGARFVSKPLRCRQMETTQSLALTGSTRSIALASDYLEHYAAYLTGDDGQELQYLPPHAYWAKYYNDSVTSQPTEYTIEGLNIRFGDIPDKSYTGKLGYWAKAPALTEAAPTNWLLTAAPGIYLYGALIEAVGLIGDDDRATAWHQQFLAAVGGLQASDAASRRPRSGAKLRSGLPAGSGGFDWRTG